MVKRRAGGQATIAFNYLHGGRRARRLHGLLDVLEVRVHLIPLVDTARGNHRLAKGHGARRLLQRDSDGRGIHGLLHDGLVGWLVRVLGSGRGWFGLLRRCTAHTRTKTADGR